MISNIRVKNFRNFSERSFEFGDKITLITGKNGSGKTNLLEAITSIISNGKGFRSSNKYLINNEASSLFIELNTKNKDGLINKYGLYIDHKGKKYFKDTKRQYSLPKIFKEFPILIILPEHREIFRGERSLRRGFFDNIILRLDAEYSKILSNYNKILRSRRYLLYEGKKNKYYDNEWKKYGAQIIKKRLDCISEINSLFKDNFNIDIVLGYATTIDKISSNSIENILENIQLKMDEVSNIEIQKKKILTGPHLDDFKIMYRSKDTKNFSSSNEIKFVLMWLKFAEVILIESKYKRQPIILIDEFSDSLDTEKALEIIKRFPDNQIFLSSCHSDINNIIKECKLIELD